MSINERLSELRKLMEEKNIDLYIVNTSDPHQSEYVADRFKSRVWITGFTGSAGTAVITKEKALLWTDGRYFVQAEEELKGSEFQMMKMGIIGVPTYTEWIRDNIEEGQSVGFDGETFAQSSFESLEGKFLGMNINFVTDFDLIGEIWTDRPEMPKTPAFIHELEYTGRTAREKIEEVRQAMIEEDLDYFLLGSLDDIAWLYNIRSRDVKNNPVVISYGLVSRDRAILFVDQEKINKDVETYLTDNGVDLKPYEDILECVSKLDDDKRLYLEKDRINRLVYSHINENLIVLDGINITTSLKAIKNPTEIENQRKAYLKDGVALTKFLYWLDENIPNGSVSELSAEESLFAFRQDQEGFIENSFDPISAYGSNGAMMHYKADENSNRKIENKGLYLIDSGGQYYEGTTDVTRTIAAGPLTEEEIRDFTLVLKGHIGLSDAKFLYGTTGHALDVLARQPLWKHGIDYKCGTGHGIGFLLNVHEGPHRIATAPSSVILEEGMITSNEPGVYRAGKHGIRIENVLVVKEEVETDSGLFMAFENLSFVPIDLRAIDKNLLIEDEIKWLNDYHRETYLKLEKYMTDDERKWLKERTKEI